MITRLMDKSHDSGTSGKGSGGGGGGFFGALFGGKGGDNNPFANAEKAIVKEPEPLNGQVEKRGAYSLQVGSGWKEV